MSISDGNSQLIDAIKGLTAKLKQEQIRTFKDDITIKMLTVEIGRLKALLNKKTTPSVDFGKMLREVNKSLQDELSITDDDIAAHVESVKRRIQNIRPLV